MGFHPYQDIQKSLNYLKENHVNVFTLDSTVIPSTVGSASFNSFISIIRRMVNSPSNFATEKELIDAIVSSYSSHSDVVFIKPHSYFTQDDLQQTLVSIHQHLSQKHISDSHLLRLTQKVAFRRLFHHSTSIASPPSPSTKPSTKPWNDWRPFRHMQPLPSDAWVVTQRWRPSRSEATWRVRPPTRSFQLGESKSVIVNGCCWT